MTALDAQGRRLPPATKPYRPSNGSEGMEFMAHWCDRCQREAKYRETDDGADGCPIATAAFVYDLGDPEYPPEWIAEDGWKNPRCTAYEPETDGEPRCPDTMELPL